MRIYFNKKLKKHIFKDIIIRYSSIVKPASQWFLIFSFASTYFQITADSHIHVKIAQ